MLRDLRSEVAFDLEKSVWDWGFRRKRWDRSTSLIHLRTCITSVFVLLYDVLGLRDGLGLYMEHWIGVGPGIQRSGSEMPLGVFRKPLQRL